MGKEIKSSTGKRQKIITQHNKFVHMGNLLFFPEGSDFAKERFFFFNTLLSDYAKTNNEPYYSKYVQKANDIGNRAKTALSNSPLDIEDAEGNTRFMEIMTEAIKILKQGIIYEQNNELRYIQKKINDFYKKFSKEQLKNNKEVITVEKILKQLKANEGIDYTSLINLINILNQGLDNTKSIYKSEQDHMKSITKEYFNAQENYLNQLEGLSIKRGKGNFGEKQITKFSDKFARETQKIYLQNKTFNLKSPKTRVEQIVNANMGNTKSVDVKISNIVTTILKAIFKQKKLLEKLNTDIKTSQLAKGLTDSDYSPSEQELKQAIIRATLSYAKANMSKLLKNSDNLNVNYIIKDLGDFIAENDPINFEFNIEGMYSNFGEFGHHLDFFKNYNGEHNAQQLYNAVEELYFEVGKQVKGHKQLVKDLTEEQQQTRKILGLDKKNSELVQVIKLIKNLQKYLDTVEKDGENATKPVEFITTSVKTDKTITLKFHTIDGKLIIDGDFLNSQINEDFFNFKQFNPKKLSSLISLLKSRTSSNIETLMKNKINLAKDKEIQEAIYNALEQGLQNLHVSVGGPTWNEILPLIQASLKDGKLWTGKKNLKTDSILIQVGAENIPQDATIKIPENIIENLTERALKEKDKMLKDYTDNFVQAIETDFKNFSGKKKYNHFKEYADNFFQQQSIREKYINQTQAKIKEINDLLKDTQDEQTIKELQDALEIQQAFLNDIQNTLLISTTSKTYNNYMNNVGFVGGSLGQTIYEQISHLNDIFSSAGFPLSQDEIDWLTFAAINNSSLSVVRHQNENKIETILGSLATFALFTDSAAEVSILKSQLKNLNFDTPGIMHLYFVNGMYYPGSFVLSQALQNIEQIMVTINEEINRSNYKNIRITSNIKFNDIPNNENHNEFPKDTDPWRTVAKKAERKTTIHILFLAGLMSVVDGLLAQFDEIKLPS